MAKPLSQVVGGGWASNGLEAWFVCWFYLCNGNAYSALCMCAYLSSEWLFRNTVCITLNCILCSRTPDGSGESLQVFYWHFCSWLYQHVGSTGWYQMEHGSKFVMHWLCYKWNSCFFLLKNHLLPSLILSVFWCHWYDFQQCIYETH